MRINLVIANTFFNFSVSSPQMITLTEATGQASTYTTQKLKSQQPAIHISALPSRQNNQMELPSFSIPLQYNLGSFKRIDEEIHFDLEANTTEVEQPHHWDGRMMTNFNLMNIKPLLENRDIEMKYEVKNENRVVYTEVNNTVQAIEAEDILGKETINEGQTISPDFEIERFQSYQSHDDKRYTDGFEGTNAIEAQNKCDFVCDSDFLCSKGGFAKETETKRNDFELLDTDNHVEFENNI